MRDSIAATTFVALIAGLLMLQGMLSAYAQTAMIGDTGADGFGIICSSSDITHVASGSDDRGNLPKMADCPCATLCRLASADIAAIIGPVFDPMQPAAGLWVAVDYQLQPMSPRPSRGLIAEPRAPPVFA